jgi:DNA-binding PadR family transcriptional regulator
LACILSPFRGDLTKKGANHVRDKRAKLDLELFVLALLKEGVNTPYRLQSEASISPGATLPVLTRLQQAGYVRRGKSGPRRRAEYEVTAAGRSFLKNQWQPLFEGPVPSEIEAIFRIATLASLSGASKGAISNYLKMAAEQRQKGRQRGRDTNLAANWPSAESMGELYSRMRQMYAAARLNTEAKILRNLAVQIKKPGRR